ncbi:4'-phosphopantetheinyl transferase [Talaromyces pinophilus]|uniref:holo-[acyl-carrier-protein] synthase n=1 Tax=Talaromyces pinophilus TaxID=128442 RepID=A0A6V8H2X1_TALPI|nr:4'-phosphopantetheinyl transferase [Talaromyces pinophilus]
MASTHLTRWYIDTRHLTNTTQDLPLLTTLQETEQTSIKKYLRLPDRHMSLASNLLKYLYIHQTCRIPWSEVIISRTPKPHQRPCFIPSGNESRPAAEIPAVEFNVTHQASFVALAGCVIPSTAKHDVQDDDSLAATQAAVFSAPKPSSAPIPSVPQVGIDVTCVDEPGRRRDKTPKTLKDVTDFIDIFKETWLYGKRVEDVRVELVAFETDYLVATAARGADLGEAVRGGDDPWRELVSVDIERDVRPCATGICQCLA